MEKYKLLGQLNPKQMWAAVDECYKQPTAAPPILARLPAMPRAPCALFDRLVAALLPEPPAAADAPAGADARAARAGRGR